MIDPVQPACCLLQGVDVVARLQDDDGREVRQIQPSFHQIYSGDQYAAGAIYLVEDPILASGGVHRGKQYRYLQTARLEHLLEPSDTAPSAAVAMYASTLRPSALFWQHCFSGASCLRIVRS